MSGTAITLAAFTATGFYSGNVSEDAQGDLFIYSGFTASGSIVADAVYEIANTATGYAAAPALIATVGDTEGTPHGALSIDANGDIFGVSDDGDGSIFEIVHTTTGYANTPTVLASFNGRDGISPNGSLIEDASGDLFDTTYSFAQDGQVGGGEIFELVNTPTGYAATPTVLAQFNGVDGYEPGAGLVMDANGDLFGTTEEGPGQQEGNQVVLTGQGEVFELQNTATGYAVTPSILLALDGDDGAMPLSQLLLAANGNLYGDTYIGGVDAITGDPASDPDTGGGVVFDIPNAPSGGAQANEVYFHGESQTGPGSNLVEDAAGDLFGITTAESGAIFEIQNTATGLASTPILLASLDGSAGSVANSTMVADPNGDLIGSTTSGGANGDGAVFELVNTGFFVRAISISGTEANQPASDQTPIAPFGSVSINDPNPNQTEIVTVTPSTTANGTLVDPNAATDGANIDGGVWTITGSLAAVTADLRALEFQPTTSGVSFGQTLTTSFTVAVADSDGQAAHDTKTSVVATAMAPSSDLPIFTGGSISRPLNLIADAHGDLFGVEDGGLTGLNSDGGIFEIANTASGYSAPFLLAGFSGLNGISPDAPLIIDANGDLFGTTSGGGAFGGLPGGLGGGIQGGDGVVFEIKNTATGYDSTPIAVASFDVTDGRDLQRAGLIMDANGDLIGEAFAGGPNNQGDIFEIANTPTGYASTPKVLTSFSSTDARAPIGGLTTDAAGDLFGTTQAGGTNGEGTVFEIKMTGTGYAAAPTILVNFSGLAGPQGSSLLIDANGDLFGTTGDGGADNDGTIYEILNTSTGYASTPTTLASFDRTDGADPTGSLMFDANGDLLGTTADGGAFTSAVDPPFGDGTVFEIANNNGTYASTPTVLVSLTHAEGYNPGQTLLLTASGTILGTASLGGPDGWGAVFGISGTGITLAPPAISGTTAGQTVSDLATINPFATVGVTDQNPDQIETVTVTPSNAANGSLVDPNAANDGGADANGMWTFTGSPLAVTQDLQGLVFDPTPTDATLGTTITTGFTISVTDSLGLTATDTTTSVDATASVPSNVLYSFNEANALGWVQLSQDAAGDVFVAATYGGQGYSGPGTGYGSILEFTWTGTGYAATPTLLTEFQGTNGENPAGTLLVDASGNLFGATEYGGTDGNGTLFELAKVGNGYASTPTVLVNFNGTDGQDPVGGLIEDPSGDLFGVTYSGGPGYDGSPLSGEGTVFELVKNGASYAAAPTTLATFAGPGASDAEAGLVMDAKGDLFGTTAYGGAYDAGEVYEIVNTATGYSSVPQVLLSFDGTHARLSQFPLYIDANRDLFGTTALGTSTGTLGDQGTVFEIANTPTGYSSNPTYIYFDNANGSDPYGGLIADAAGDLFGVTDPDSISAGYAPGSVYEIQNTATGLASTPDTQLAMGGNVGSDPIGPLIDDPAGDLVGSATSGGANGDGTLFELPASFVEAPSSPNGLLHMTLQQGQSISLDTLALNPAVTTSGILQSVTLAGGGTATVQGTVTVNTLEISDGSVSLEGGLLLTDPVTVDADGDISGYGTVTGTTTNNGTVIAVGGLLDMTGSITGAGTLAIENGATLELGSGVDPQQIVQFDTSAVTGSAELLLDDPIGFAGTIGRVVAGDSIALTPADAILSTASLDASGHILTLSGSLVGGSTGTIGTVTFAETLASDDVSVGNNAVTLTETPAEVACFLPGTLIATDHGEVPVERLAVGDRLRMLHGSLRSIMWIGTGAALATRGRRNAATPIIVQKGAIADNVPHHDLRVTKGHALFLDGVLIPVEFLVNHRSIRWDDRAQEVRVFHIELDAHDVLLANGAPAESYRDDGNRWLFQNANTGWELPPHEPCAPVLTGGPIVDAVWRRLLDRASPRPGLALTEDPDLHLVVDGERVDAVSRHGTSHIFALLAPRKSVRAVSRAASPTELGLARDPRMLGVAARRIAVRQRTRFRVIEAADPLLTDGFHRFEPVTGLRWTDGDAGLPMELFEGFDGPVELVLHVGCTAQYPLFGEAVGRTAA
jgi:Hint domain